jgi:hypothetical protein
MPPAFNLSQDQTLQLNPVAIANRDLRRTQRARRMRSLKVADPGFPNDPLTLLV